jgi:hypothetical protein
MHSERDHFTREALMMCRLGVGGGAHLLPGKYPAHRLSLIACVVAYYLLSVVSFLYSRLVVRNTIMVCKQSAEGRIPTLCIGLDMPRFASEFTLSIDGGGRCGSLSLFGIHYSVSLQQMLSMSAIILSGGCPHDLYVATICHSVGTAF